MGAPYQLQQKPNVERLEFGKYFTDHMFKVQHDKNGWLKPKIMPMESINLHPAAKVLHYAIEVGNKTTSGQKELRSFRETKFT